MFSAILYKVLYCLLCSGACISVIAIAARDHPRHPLDDFHLSGKATHGTGSVPALLL